MALDVCGGLLMVVAISRAPVSLVQPVAAGGVAVLAVFSHFRLGEKLEPRAWAGVAASVVGTVGIGLTSEDQPPAELSTFRYLLGAALIAAMLALPAHLADRAGRRRARDGKKIVGLVGVGVGTPIISATARSHLAHPAPPVATAAEPRRWWRARRLAPSSPSPR
jgi:drug/metabolite transporter (DMT)-like permease